MGLFGRPKSPEVGGGASTSTSSSSLAAYDAMVAEHLAPMRATAAAAPPTLGLLPPTERVEAAFAAQRTAIASAASAASRPSDPSTLQELLAPVAAEMTAASTAADKAPPRAPPGLAAKAAAEALQALAWLALPPPAVSPSPAQHVADAWSSAEFYANKLLMEARNMGGGEGGEGVAAAQWVAGLKGLVATGLKAYVTAHHARGLAFGVGAGGAGAAAAAAAAAPKRAGPPPPPPPPPGGPPSANALLSDRNKAAPSAAAAPAAGGMSAVLASLNRGTAVTSGLRKVTDDMKAKNRADRSGAVPASEAAAAAANPAPAAAAPTKTAPPRLELEQDRRWVVENYTPASAPSKGQEPLVVKVTDPKQAVYVSRCKGPGLVIRVEGRVASLTVDACSRVGVVFDEVVASCEVVNCQSVQVQCLGKARTVSVDKTDGCQLFVPRGVALDSSFGFQLVTAKSSEVNVTVVPSETEMDKEGMDAVEHAVPEQFVSTFGKDGRLGTVPASHGGG
jgi:adenylyl cyclase-associated protein